MNRGNSLIAGVVLIGILGSLSIALQATTPQLEKRVAVAPSSQVAATTVGGADGSAIVCTPGFSYSVYMKGGKPLTTCSPEVYSNCEAPKTKDKQKSCTVEEAPGRNLPAAKNPKEDCAKTDYYRIYHCVPKGFGNACGPEKGKLPGSGYDYYTQSGSCCKDTKVECNVGEALTVKEASKYAGESLAGLGAEAAKEGKGEISKAVKDAISENKADSSFASAFNSSFRPEVEQQEREVQTAKTNYEQCQARKDCADEAKLYNDEKKKLDEMYATQKRLAAAATTLEVPCPPDKECPGRTSPPPGSGGGGSGAGGSGQRPPSTFPNQNNQQVPNQQNQQQQNPYQQCYPQYFCVNNTLYWGTQQQNYYYSGGQQCQTQVVQQCQHGCQGNACAQNPQSGTGQNSQTQPTATLSCGGDGDLFDVGAGVPISFSCANSVSSTGSGFSTGGQLSGAASTTIQKPPAGADMVSYGLTCTASNNQTASKRCDVKINVTSIVMVANPKQVAPNASTTIGWVTKGMKECVIQALDAAGVPDLEKFNTDNEDITNVSGVAVTPGLSRDTGFELTCKTKTDEEKRATVNVKIRN